MNNLKKINAYKLYMHPDITFMMCDLKLHKHLCHWNHAWGDGIFHYNITWQESFDIIICVGCIHIASCQLVSELYITFNAIASLYVQCHGCLRC